MKAPFPLERPVLRGHLDGFCIVYMNAEVAVFPDYDGAAEGYRMAHAALALLTDVFVKARAQR